LIGQPSTHITITKNLPKGTIGLRVGEGKVRSIGGSAEIPCFALLVFDEVWYVPSSRIRKLSEQEIERTRNE
jgi:hypothetical protein